jgi:CBS domain containing-hemolysin-like protein
MAWHAVQDWKYLQQRKLSAKTALELSEHPELFLSAAQIGITLISILGCIVVKNSAMTRSFFMVESLKNMQTTLPLR